MDQKPKTLAERADAAYRAWCAVVQPAGFGAAVPEAWRAVVQSCDETRPVDDAPQYSAHERLARSMYLEHLDDGAIPYKWEALRESERERWREAADKASKRPAPEVDLDSLARELYAADADITAAFGDWENLETETQDHWLTVADRAIELLGPERVAQMATSRNVWRGKFEHERDLCDDLRRQLAEVTAERDDVSIQLQHNIQASRTIEAQRDTARAELEALRNPQTATAPAVRLLETWLADHPGDDARDWAELRARLEPTEPEPADVEALAEVMWNAYAAHSQYGKPWELASNTAQTAMRSAARAALARLRPVAAVGDEELARERHEAVRANSRNSLVDPWDEASEAVRVPAIAAIAKVRARLGYSEHVPAGQPVARVTDEEMAAAEQAALHYYRPRRYDEWDQLSPRMQEECILGAAAAREALGLAAKTDGDEQCADPSCGCRQPSAAMDPDESSSWPSSHSWKRPTGLRKLGVLRVLDDDISDLRARVERLEQRGGDND